MNMSEDVTAVSMQVSEKAAEAALSAFKSVLDSIGRLFRELLGMEHDRARAKAQIKATKGSAKPEKTKPSNVTATNLTGIKPGRPHGQRSRQKCSKRPAWIRTRC